MSAPSTSLLAYLRPYRRRLAAGAGLTAGYVAISVALQFLIRFAIDDLVAERLAAARLAIYAGLYVGAALVSGTLALWMRRVMLGVSLRVEYDIRQTALAHLTVLDPAYFRGEKIGDLMTRLNSDVSSVKDLLGQGLMQSTRALFGLVFSLGVMFWIDVRLALAMLILLPGMSLCVFLLLRVIRRRYERVQEQASTVANFCQESFSGIRTLKGFALEPRWTASFRDLNREYIRRFLALSRVERPTWPLAGLLFSVGVLLLLLVGGGQVVRGRLTLGEFVQFNLYLGYLQWPMLALGWAGSLVQRGRASWGRICRVLDARSAVHDGPPSGPEAGPPAGDITFEEVCVSFGGQPVLDRVSLRIAAGEVVGLTGPTGCGKTVLASLLARLLDPDQGRVCIGGVDLRAYSLASLRAALGVAPQEAFLFSNTVAYNIAFGLGDDEPDREKVAWAAGVARLRAEVEAFPSGFETLLGERGITLSGGQRQRTAISRAIAREPAYLVLDDVFSAVDTETEAGILRGLLPLLRGRTTLLISHRVSTLRHADRIVVLEAGRVTQEGTHADLAARPGYYRDLDEVQRLEARLEDDRC